MILQDWRDADASCVADLYARERERWRARLFWDMTGAFATLEEGRRGGHVGGWIARTDDQRVAGWTYYLLHEGLLKIGGLIASRPAVSRALLDAVLTAPEAAVARGFTCFLLPDESGLQSALVRQRFSLRDSLYLVRPLDAVVAPAYAPVSPRAWSEEDFAAAVRVLMAAYRETPSAAIFAPDGRKDQWAQYVWQLLRTPGCGTFDPALSVVVPGGEAAIRGVALAGWIAPDTVHLSQLAVHPEEAGAGVGRSLLAAVVEAARERGAARVTLMVDCANARALRIYGRAGFTECARLLSASRRARSRVAA